MSKVEFRSPMRLVMHEGYPIVLWLNYQFNALSAKLLESSSCMAFVEYNDKTKRWVSAWDDSNDYDKIKDAIEHVLDDVVEQAKSMEYDRDKYSDLHAEVETVFKDTGVFYWEPSEELKYKVESLEDAVWSLENGGADPYD